MPDRVISAVTEDLAFRVITVRTTDTVRAAAQKQGATPEAAEQLAALITGAILVRTTMAPQLRVQAILHGAAHSGQLVADAHPDGWSRGLVKVRPPARSIALGSDSVLKVMRSMPNGQLHQGMVDVPAEQGIPAGIMSYMQHSEQVICVAGIGCARDGDEIVEAGGYLLQLLPEASDAPLAVMTERLAHDFADLPGFLAHHQGSAEDLLEEILYAMPHQRVEDGPLRFDCNCSPVRVLTSLATLPRSDIEQFITEGEALHLTCDYCRAEYAVEPEQLRGLLESS